MNGQDEMRQSFFENMSIIITTTENLTSIFWAARLGKTVNLGTVTEFPVETLLIAKHGSPKSRLAFFVSLAVQCAMTLFDVMCGYILRGNLKICR